MSNGMTACVMHDLLNVTMGEKHKNGGIHAQNMS